MATIESFFYVLFIISLIPIIFQAFVTFYTLKVRRFIGKTSFWLILALSIQGFIYDIIITARLAQQVDIGQELTWFALFFGFIFPLVRSGCLLALTYIMAKGLAYQDGGGDNKIKVMKNMGDDDYEPPKNSV
jgi:hypothetical protein